MRRTAAPDGTHIAYHAVEARSGCPTFVYAHATGFCGAVWAPVTAALDERIEGAGHIVVDQRAHGSSDTSPHPFDWWDIGRDLLAVLDAVDPSSPLIGVGHSGGGAGLLLAELLRHGTFHGVVAIEPIVPPPPFEIDEEMVLARSAIRRKRWFASREEARRRWRDREPFSTWNEEAFDAYLAHGLVPGIDADTGLHGVVLACAPEDEAEWFIRSRAHGAWERLTEVTCPVIVVAGMESDSHAVSPAAEITERLGHGILHMAPGSHFIPMDSPGLVAELAAIIAVRSGDEDAPGEQHRHDEL